MRKSGVIIDIDGVILKSKSVLPGSEEGLNLLIEKGLVPLFLTNNVSYNAEYLQSFFFNSLPNFFINVITPLTALEAELIRMRNSGKDLNALSYYFAGPNSIGDTFLKFGCQRTNVDANPDIVVISSILDISSSVIMDLSNAVCNCHYFYATGLEKFFNYAENVLPSTGVLHSTLEFITGKSAIILGKPSSNYFKIAQENFPEINFKYMIGDDYEIDCVPAAKLGITPIWIQSDAKDMNKEVRQAINFLSAVKQIIK